MKKQYKVTLPISVVDLETKKEALYQPGDVAELDEQTAKDYRHALIAVAVKQEGAE